MADSPIIEGGYDNIPSALKERRQWLLWDAAADTPRRPHWDGDFRVRWTDPNDWHTFEDAVEFARANETWGIGFVFRKLGDFAFMDLDGCLNSRGELKDWLPSIEPFNHETYIEKSASGTGIHIILRGFEVPEWWSDTHFSDDEHQGVEVYEQKFCAFTGSPIETSVQDVGTVDATDWLVEAHKSIHGADPTVEFESSFDDAGDGGRANREEFLDEEDIRDALNHIDPDVSYPTWRDIGFALKDFFGTSNTALSVFVDWSRGGSKWDAEAETQAERIIKDATAGGGRTIGTVIHHARSNGWNLPQKRKGSGATSRTDIDPDEVDRAEAILKSQTAPDDPVGDLICTNGGYGVEWEYTDDDGIVIESGADLVCNFMLETLSFLSIEDQEHDEFVVRVHPIHPTEQPYDVRIQPTVFNSAKTFRAEVVTGRTTWFDPSNRKGVKTITILRFLRETVGAQPAPHRTGQPYLGLSEDGFEFVTPAGSLTADGWSDDPSFEYYSIGGDNSDTGPFAQKWVLNPDDDVDVDESVVASICELLPNTRKPERGLPILGWFYAAPLKAHIHDWTNEFPLLAPHGDTGTGKTSTLGTFQRAFGGSGEPLSSTDTMFTKEKHLAESRGFPVWIDEYKPTEMRNEYCDHLHQRLKEVTKERTMPKGRPDLGIDQLHMRAPVILSGEQKISDAAVRRRSILTNLSREPTRDGTTTKEAFGELTGVAYEDQDGEQHYPDGYDLRQHARAYYGWVLAKDADYLRDCWNEAREEVKALLESFGVTLESSEQKGLQTMIFGVRLAVEFATAFGADEAKLPTDSDIRAASDHVISNIGKGGQRREHSDEFLEVLSLAATEEYLQPGIHHRVLDSQSAGTEVLAVHMPSAFSSAKRYVRDSNLEDEYTLLSKTDYLNSFGNKADVDGSYVIETNKRTRGIENGGRAVHFDHEVIHDKLGGDFSIDSFRPPEERTDDGDEATPVAELTRDGNPYASVTVEVNNWHTGPDNGYVEGGTVSDETGTIDVVDFFGSITLEEGDHYRLDNVRVSRYEGALQLEIVPDVTEAIPIQEGAGTTGGGDPENDQQSSLDVATNDSQSEAAADGGEVLPKELDEKIQQWTTTKNSGVSGADRATVASKVANEFGVGEEKVENRIDKLLSEGRRVYEPTDGTLKPI